jgi:Family of unknown function (DUF6311)
LHTNQRDYLGGVAALVLGGTVYFVIFGWWPLIPTNVAFLDHADRAMHTLGWMFFRDTPWGVPPGASPRLGVELANSIALVDGLPLFAIPLKLIGQWLPRPFQYWGYWWLLCCLLQSLFAYLFARELGAKRPIALLAAGFALIAPAFIFRLTLHMALAGHWLILAALWLYAKRTPPRLFAWPLLLALTASIHAYLLAMALALWVAAWLQRLWLGRFTRATAIGEALLAVVATAIVLWLVGFFYTGSLDSIGFGFYRLNLLWPFISYKDWSHLVPSLPHGEYDYEGISFLGVGIFAVLALSILTGAVVKLCALVSYRWLPLIVMVLLLAVWALSNHIGYLDKELPAIPIDAKIKYIGETFRSSGRFVWPLYYTIIVGAVVLLARRLPLAWATGIIAVCLVVQFVDSEQGLGVFARVDPPPADHWANELSSPFWQRAEDAGYDRLRAIPVVYRNPDWRRLEYLAYLHHFDVDAIYLGRIDDRALEALKAKEETALDTGEFEPKTLYVVDVATALRIYQHLRPQDLLAAVDRQIVFAPGGAHLIDGLGITPDLGMGD